MQFTKVTTKVSQVKNVRYPESFRRYEEELERTTPTSYPLEEEKIKFPFLQWPDLQLKKLSEDFRQSFVNELNRYRTQHGVPLLCFDEELAQKTIHRASELAASPLKLQELELNMKSNIGKGEIVQEFTNFSPTTELNSREIVEEWYSNVTGYAQYFGGEPTLFELFNYEKFTQMIWKNSSQIGFSLVLNIARQNAVFVVKFDPAGNQYGWYGTNVLNPFKPLPTIGIEN